ncbi:MAG: hypothetical protein WCV58_00795 [Patescibacteria group bacterium]
MKKENTFFKNRLIVLYPFHFINYTPDGKHLTGSKFRSLKIRHLPYHPNTKKTEKPNKILKAFFDDLFRKFYFIDGFNGVGYSIHRYQDGKADDTMVKIKEDIELLYYIFERSNHKINTKFPKFYLIKDINYYKETARFGCSFYEDYIDPSVNSYITFYNNEIDKNYLTYFKTKAGNLYQPSIDKEWEKFFSKKQILPEIFWGIYWYNKAKDETRDKIEKIVYLVIALENILDLSYQNTDEFALKIKNELELNSNDNRVCVFCSFIRQAHKSRCGIVHGIENTEELKLRAEWGKEKYFNLDFYLSESFKIIIDKKISGQPIPDFRKNILLERIYPNKAKLDDFWKIAKKKKQIQDDITMAFRSLRDFKQYDDIGIDKNLVSKVIQYINLYSKSVFNREIRVEAINNLIQDKSAWQDIRNLITELEKQNGGLLSQKTIEAYMAMDGLIDFLNFLCNYIMHKNIELMNKSLKLY